MSNACFQSSITRKGVDWHPKPERKAARNGLKIFSRKFTNCASIAFSKFFDIAGKTLTGL